MVNSYSVPEPTHHLFMASSKPSQHLLSHLSTFPRHPLCHLSYLSWHPLWFFGPTVHGCCSTKAASSQKTPYTNSLHGKICII